MHVVIRQIILRLQIVEIIMFINYAHLLLVIWDIVDQMIKHDKSVE